jgi:hypothetical protein
VVTNTGYRLLRSTLRFEPNAPGWARVAPAFAAGPFTTAETTEIPIEVQIPETLPAPLSSFLVIESNGGSRRVEIRVEPPAKPELPPEGVIESGPPVGMSLREALEQRSAGSRLIGAALVGVGLRVLVLLGDGLTRVMNLGEVARPSLSGTALVLAAVGGIAGARLAGRRGEPRDVPPGAFTGAVAGVLAAAISVAACRAIEPIFGRLVAGSPVGACLLWAMLGVLTGLGSLVLAPYKPSGESTS